MPILYKKPKTKANPLRYDPTRTGPLRRRFMVQIEAKFKELERRIYQFVAVKNPFRLTTNYDPNQARDEHGRFIPSYMSSGQYPLHHVTAQHHIQSILKSGLGKEGGTISWTRDPYYAIQDKKVRIIIKNKSDAGLVTHPHVGMVSVDAVGEHLVPAHHEHEEISLGVLPTRLIHAIHVPKSVMDGWVEAKNNNTATLGENLTKLEGATSERKKKLYGSWVQESRERIAAYDYLIDHPKIKVVDYKSRNRETGQLTTINYNPSQPRVPAGSSHGGEWTNHEHAAIKMAYKAAKVFGLDKPEVEISRDSTQSTFGEHNASGKVQLMNVHEGRAINRQLNYQRKEHLTEGEHLAAHEVAHTAYSKDSELGAEIMWRLKEINAEYGSSVSMYGAVNGAFENLMELGSSYIHSPKQLKEYSKEMHDLAQEWVVRLKGKPHDSGSQSSYRTVQNIHQSDQEESGNGSICSGTERLVNLGLRTEVQKTSQNNQTLLHFRKLDHVETNVNSDFTWATLDTQLEMFKEWITSQMKDLFYPGDTESWWKQYIAQGWQQGAKNVYDRWRNPSSFLASSFNQPVSVAKVKLLAARVLTELQNITTDMATKMIRELVDGLIEGKSPREVAKDIVESVDGISKQRALTIARTETIRAHAEGQLDTLETLGMGQVGIAVEFSGSGVGVTKKGNPSPCAACAHLVGIVLTLQEARGVIPVHPNCMCSFVPANVGEDGKNQIRSFQGISTALQKALKASQPKARKGVKAKQSSWRGAKVKLDKSRPTSIFNVARDQPRVPAGNPHGGEFTSSRHFTSKIETGNLSDPAYKAEYSTWKKGLKPVEGAMIVAWVGGDAKGYPTDKVAHIMRDRATGKTLREKENEGSDNFFDLKHLKEWNDALDRAPKYHGIAYRGIYTQQPEQFTKNSEVTFKATSSCSRNPEIAVSFSQGVQTHVPVVFKIQMKTGVDVKPFSGKYKGQEEILARRDTKYKVVKVTEDVSHGQQIDEGSKVIVRPVKFHLVELEEI